MYKIILRVSEIILRIFFGKIHVYVIFIGKSYDRF